MDRSGTQHERQRLEDALRRARRRVDEAVTGSPDWDAAMAAVEDLEARLHEAAVSAAKAS